MRKTPSYLISPLLVLLVSLTLPGAEVRADSPSSPLTPIAEITDYSPTEFPIVSHEGRLFFSQYDRSGNNFDVIAFDMADQSSEYIVRGRPGAQFVAQDTRFLVVGEKANLRIPSSSSTVKVEKA
jgi:hypothetical protein